PAALIGISVSPTQPAIAAGTTVQLAATATYSDGTTADITAAAAWSSDRQGIATVFQGLVRGRARGDATITARFNSAFFASTRIAVGAPRLVSIAVTPDNPILSLGTPQQLTATGTFTDASTQDLTAQVAWTSSATSVATISPTGLASTVGTGTTTITATQGTISGSVQLMVASAAVQSIAIAPATPDVALGADHPFTATATFSDLSTADVTDQVAWSSSDPLVATISNTAGSRGVADARGTGATAITATLGALSSTTQMTVFLAPVGPWAAEPGFAGVQGCADGIKFSMASDYVYVCTTTAGMMRGQITGTAIAWSSPSTGLTNLQGQAIAAHTMSAVTMMYMGAPQPGVANWFRSNDSAATFTPSLLLDSAGNPRAFYAGRFQPMIGNILGSWDPGAGTPQAVVVTGSNPPTAVHPIAGATGTVRAIAGSAANNLYVGVLGETPAGAPATGGVFRSTNSGVTWVAQDTGIPAADKDLVVSVVIDPGNANVLYAGLRGGGRVYKTTDAGATWTPSAAGIPAKARVTQLLISPQSASTVYAATNLGLYRSTDAGATWVLAGFQGRAIRGVAQSGADGTLILVAVVEVDGTAGLYRAM
ncbi:MAG TPA: Ig-like domain-containing protein, partial [Kofleriaceae bacterium]|nr:Ig-like domain-containing protein [Kofleriaceae bacterium]